MSKRKRSNGSQAAERRKARGRGLGRGAAFRPWLRVQDVPSCGLSSRIRSPITGREHHLLSNLERNWFLVLHSLQNLRDCREQFPLPIEETLEIAHRLRIKHPTDPRTQEPQVMTTDMVVSLAHGPREVDIARAVKPAEQLVSTRVLEKLELERVFWQSRNVEWAILTDRELPPVLLRNMRWVFPYLELERFSDFASADIARIQMSMESAIVEGSRPILQITADCDAALGLKRGTALLLARHFIGTRVWPVDLNVPIDLRSPLNLLTVPIHDDTIIKHAA